jgi:plasmid stabilization system protein ParE
MPAAHYRVVVTGTAETDLDEVERYWIQRGEEWRGAQDADDLTDFADRTLSDGPTARRGRTIGVPGHAEARAILAFGVYRIIYRIDEAAGVVKVLRFWHTHRDTPPLE